MRNFVRSLGIGAAAFLLTASLVPLQPAPAHAASCSNYEFIAARGTGEDKTAPESEKYTAVNSLGMGDLGYSIYKQLTALAPGVSINPYGVHYPAVDVHLVGALSEYFPHVNPSYNSSVAIGTSDVENELAKTNLACPTTKFIVVGYSQGAQAVGNALEAIAPALKQQIVATVLFGNPYFNPNDAAADMSNFDPNRYGFLGPRNSGGWKSIISSPVFDFCHDGDPICGGVAKIGSLYPADLYHLKVVATSKGTSLPLGQHTNYGSIGPDARNEDKTAAYALARLIGAPVTTAQTSGPSDTVFVIDSTGSMGSTIAEVQSNVVQLANTIASKSPDFRFALVDYKDDPGDDSAYQSRVDVPFTTSTSTFSDGVSSIVAAGGGDTPESMYSGIMTGLNLPWRTGVKKTVIVISDAPGKDPEPVTGYTLSQVTAKALAVDPAQVYAVQVGSDPDAQTFMQAVADANGGTLTTPDASGSFIDGLQSAILDAGNAPTAVVTGDSSVETGSTTEFSAAGTTSDPSDPIVGYDWNFGTGTAAGSYDTTTTTPIVSTSFATPGTYDVTVRVRTKSGLAGLASASITATAPSTAAPSTPSGLAAAAGDGTVTLTFSAGSGAAPLYYVVKDGSGATLVSFTPSEATGVQTWTDTDLTDGVARTYSVYAVNSAGTSGAAGPVTATPTGATTTPTPPPGGSAGRATIVVPSSPVRANSWIKVKGSNFAPRHIVIICISKTRFNIAAARTDRSGAFTAWVQVPRGTSPGSHTLTAWSGKQRVSAAITVRR